MILQNEERIVIVARFLAKAGREHDLLEALQALMVPTRREQGCIRYELNQQADNARVLTYIEKFRDQAAVDLHASTDYIAGFFKDAAPALAETIDVTYHREILA